jgi:hypothetical protein
MAYRVSVLAAASGVFLFTTSAMAGGVGCTDCYRHVSTPPVYGSVAESVMVRAPHTIAHTVPGHYQTVAEKVMVSPPRKVWQVTRDAHGHKVGCWVVIPGQYAVHHRRVMVHPPRVVHHAMPAVYATHQRTVLVRPASSGWQPIAGHSYGHHRKSYHGYGHGGSRYGGGFGWGETVGDGRGGFGYGVSDASVAVGGFVGGLAGGVSAGLTVDTAY